VTVLADPGDNNGSGEGVGGGRTTNKTNRDGKSFVHERGTARVKNLLNAWLDISGILLGIYLVSVATWALVRGYDNIIWWVLIWWSILLCGVCAFLIHLFRYLGWNVRRFFGLREQE
jgi:hypothetical protein